jgi:hypothetical protein
MIQLSLLPDATNFRYLISQGENILRDNKFFSQQMIKEIRLH